MFCCTAANTKTRGLQVFLGCSNAEAVKVLLWHKVTAPRALNRFTSHFFGKLQIIRPPKNHQHSGQEASQMLVVSFSFISVHSELVANRNVTSGKIMLLFKNELIAPESWDYNSYCRMGYREFKI